MTSTPSPKILVFAGSWRPGALSAKLAALAARKLKEAGASVTEISLGDYPLPLVDARGYTDFPPEAAALRELFESHDGLYIVTPEYNAGYPPALKNALDWASVVKRTGPASTLAGKTVAVAGTSPGAMGAYRALTQLRTVLELGFGALIVPEMVALGGADKGFDDKGELTDERSAGFLEAQVKRLIKLASHKA